MRGAVWVALVALWVLGAAGVAWALPADTWLVAVGANRGDAREASLFYAERDARELAEVLRAQGGVPPGQVRLLLSADADAVRRVLGEVNAALRASGGRRPAALIVYYSGHADAAALHLSGTQLPIQDLRGLINGSPASIRLLIVDACRSGVVTRVKGVTPGAHFDLRLEDRLVAEGTAIITSSTADESSQESDLLRGSFFTHHLVTALRGVGDRDADGRVTLTEAYAYSYAQTLRSSGQTPKLQHPTYAWDVRGASDLVLTSLRDASRGLGRVRLGGAATYLVSEGRVSGAVVAELASSREGALLVLPGGRYVIEQRREREYREYQLSLAPGAEVDLAALPFRAVRYDRLVRKGGARGAASGLSLLAGAQGEVLAGEGITPWLALAYQLDLRWLTAGLRLRGTTARLDGSDLPSRHESLGLGITLERYVDLPLLSVSFGLAVDALLHHQRYHSDGRDAPGRTSLGGAFFGILAAERHLAGGVAARLSGGPAALVYRRARVEAGAQVGEETGSAVTWWLGGGLAWRR